MNTFEKHELFQIEVLEKLKSQNFLQALVFGGGTMLRLCHDLDRYSVDLDFWFIKEIPLENYFEKLKGFLQIEYELTDAQIKFYSLLVEIRSAFYPRHLKIEIRKAVKNWDVQENIAFSPLSNIQVLVKTHTLQQTMRNKIDAFIERNEIRDAYDLEFLLRKGVHLPPMDKQQRDLLLERIDQFSATDIKVKLGSIINSEKRAYYIANGFGYLKGKLLENA